MTKKIKLYVAEYRAWGADKSYHRYFYTLAARNEFVATTNYTRKAGSVNVDADELGYMDIA